MEKNRAVSEAETPEAEVLTPEGTNRREEGTVKSLCVNDGVTSWKWAGCVSDDVTGAGNMASAAQHIIRGGTVLAE